MHVFHRRMIFCLIRGHFVRDNANMEKWFDTACLEFSPTHKMAEVTNFPPFCLQHSMKVITQD